MAKAVSDLSVAELERLLNSKKSKLETLTKKRDKLRKELSQVEKMLEQEEFVLSFTGAVYGHTRQIAANQAVIKLVDLKRYHIRKLLTSSSTNAEIKEVLKQHNIRVGGRKHRIPAA